MQILSSWFTLSKTQKDILRMISKSRRSGMNPPILGSDTSFQVHFKSDKDNSVLELQFTFPFDHFEKLYHSKKLYCGAFVLLKNKSK